VIDEHGAVATFNENFLHMWRLPRAAAERAPRTQITEALSAQFADPGAFVERIEAIYAESPAETFDVLRLADGRVFERYSRLQGVEGRSVGRVWSFRDITERNRLLESERAARAQAERQSELKDEFLATLSHELRTPLSAILGWAHVLRRRKASEAELHQGLDAIARNARMQAQLIEDLLDMSRITSGKMRLDVQPVDPLTFVEAALETVRPAAAAKAVRLEKMLDPAAGPVSGDPHRLQQVTWNLLSNAIKFTPKGGKVQVVLQRVNSHIELSVADTGIGIRPDFLAHVFERFRQADASTTRQQAGLGLGLSIVKQLVELHGGTVRAHSLGEGRGTTFTVELPLLVVQRSAHGEPRVHPSSPPTSEPHDYLLADLSGICVLVVDDEPDARDLLRHVLADCGAEVLTAADATGALSMVQARRPDLLVTDIGLPGVDGYELLRRVRALGEDAGGKVAAIALTAFARSEDRTRALRAGFLVHIAKPVEPAELVATVASVAGRVG
jgi:signal transduction histidine kinase/CheY-like chemotaxis protein